MQQPMLCVLWSCTDLALTARDRGSETTQETHRDCFYKIVNVRPSAGVGRRSLTCAPSDAGDVGGGQSDRPTGQDAAFKGMPDFQMEERSV